MPIRFRCSQCDRLLGIARRKSGTQIRCPQCGEITTVPSEDGPGTGREDRTLQDIDDLLGPDPLNNSSAHIPVLAPPPPMLVTVDASVIPEPEPAVEYAPPPPRPSAPKPVAKPKAPPRPAPKKEDSLFEQDVDDLLGLGGEEPLTAEAVSDAKPVSGADAMSLDDGPGTITLSSQKATLIVVVAVILMLIAFVTGFAIRATI